MQKLVEIAHEIFNICFFFATGGLNGNPTTKLNVTTAEFKKSLPKILKKAPDRVRQRK